MDYNYTCIWNESTWRFILKICYNFPCSYCHTSFIDVLPNATKTNPCKSSVYFLPSRKWSDFVCWKIHLVTCCYIHVLICYDRFNIKITITRKIKSHLNFLFYLFYPEMRFSLPNYYLSKDVFNVFFYRINNWTPIFATRLLKFVTITVILFLIVVNKFYIIINSQIWAHDLKKFFTNIWCIWLLLFKK